MITIEVNLPIGNEAENRWMAMWGEENVVFSLETVRRIFEENADEKDFTLNINCDGGYVDEGLAIYDYIRTSGKNIHCNILSGCHSMAVVLLLTAPLEWRTANKHAMALIHSVRCDAYDATAEDMERASEELRKSEEAILNIYADRTGEDIEVLRALMKEEKVRDTDFLLEHKFIGSVNAYNTNLAKRVNKQNQNQNEMAKTKNEALQMAKDCLSRIANLLGGKKNYDHTDNDGNVLFSTEVEDDTLEVGMNATPDGTFELPDGRTIIISGGVITEIKEATTEEEGETDEEKENLKNEVANLTAEIENLRTQLNESAEVITELQSQLASNYKPANVQRHTPAKKPEEKNALEENREKMAKLCNK